MERNSNEFMWESSKLDVRKTVDIRELYRIDVLGSQGNFLVRPVYRVREPTKNRKVAPSSYVATDTSNMSTEEDVKRHRGRQRVDLAAIGTRQLYSPATPGNNFALDFGLSRSHVESNTQCRTAPSHSTNYVVKM